MTGIFLPAMLDQTTVAFINHLLRGAGWARDALKSHAGKTARFEVVPFSLSLTVLESGEVVPAARDAAPATTIELTPGLMLRFAARDDSAWREVGITGDTDFAATIHQLARDLRWDVEEDLSRVFGDIPAHRMAETGRTLQRWGEQAAENTGRSFVEYWTEEQPLIASAREIEEFNRAVDGLRDETARLEKRVEQVAGRR